MITRPITRAVTAPLARAVTATFGGYRGPSLILGFATQQYAMGEAYAQPTSEAFGDIVTFTRASGGGRFNSSGQYEWVGDNVPRLDYDPVTLQPRGLLVEEQRTNLLLHSSDFSNVIWTLFNVSGSATRSGNAFTFGPSASDRVIQISPSVTAQSYSGSVTISGSGSVRFYLIDGAGSTGAPLEITLTAEPREYKLSRVFAAASGNGGVGIYNNSAGVGGTSFTIHRIQLEVGAFPTSYIPTTTAQVTRAADVASVNTLSPWYREDEGAWKVRAQSRVGTPLLTAGSAVITADSTAIKDYTLSYSGDQSASSVIIGKGHIASIAYYPRAGA